MHKVHALHQKLKGRDSNKPAQTTKTCHASFPLVVSSHHIPLLSCHGPSTVRGEHSCRDSRPLGSHTHYQASFIPRHSMSKPIWQLSATFANSQSCKKREILSPDPCNTLTRNASLHTLPSREPLEDTLSVFRPNFASALPHWTIVAAHLPFFSQLRDLKSIPTHCFFRHYVQGDERTLLENISREAGEADARVDERAEGLIVRCNRLVLLNQEEKELATRPVLSRHVPVHRRCA